MFFFFFFFGGGGGLLLRQRLPVAVGSLVLKWGGGGRFSSTWLLLTRPLIPSGHPHHSLLLSYVYELSQRIGLCN